LHKIGTIIRNPLFTHLAILFVKICTGIANKIVKIIITINDGIKTGKTLIKKLSTSIFNVDYVDWVDRDYADTSQSNWRGVLSNDQINSWVPPTTASLAALPIISDIFFECSGEPR
jgi:hypothetical protein